ncbi:hypothetical protein CW362_09830 [Streptomyces populi]|uniref:MxaD family protein n=1 Tax=Streptomyces populi TaxID=2058924 RepID=A0A2I0STG9_9ACTN|nr:SRPBCC family protein [Streptomyces populi]PKT73226.1 hypothetical protein CW362_09830 [Streptomyces populi]
MSDIAAAGPTSNADTPAVRARAMRLLHADVERIWQAFSDFGAISAWHPLIATSCLEEVPAATGCSARKVRLLRTVDGAVIREELLECDERRRTLSYRFLESPFPVSDYRATVVVAEPSGPDGRCQVTWTARFTPHDPAATESLRRAFGDDVFRAGLQALQRHLD